MWSDHGSGGDQDVTFWRIIVLPSNVALGDIVNIRYGELPGIYCCVRAGFVDQGCLTKHQVPTGIDKCFMTTKQRVKLATSWSRVVIHSSCCCVLCFVSTEHQRSGRSSSFINCCIKLLQILNVLSCWKTIQKG